MLSLTKILVLAALVVAVWYGFRYVARLQARQKQPPPQAPGKREDRRVAAEDMVRCQACGTYVPAVGAGSCGRPGCPNA
ncbi:MAG: hypothetical protein RLY86_4251 [Pseudomonadota bacterium]|jgi:uncharacterized protein